MNQIEVEGWTRRVIAQVLNNQPNEDSRVELKAEWPVPDSTVARRLGGHANAARGASILWIIGIDQKRGLIGAEAEEMANWWPQVQRGFDELAPRLCFDLNVPIGEHPVVALLFETDRFPFLTKNPDPSRPVTLEIPWREGTRTRSAKRGDVIDLVTAVQRRPDIEVVDASGSCGAQEGAGDDVSTGCTGRSSRDFSSCPGGTHRL